TKLFEASRYLALGRVTLIELVAQIVSALCILGWILIDRSIWALVAGNLSGALLVMVLSHACLSGIANRWQWDKSAFQEVVHFGKCIFLSSILSFLVSSADRLLLGGMVDATVLGVYVIAYLFVDSVEQVSTRYIHNVGFPALCEMVRERRAEL